MSNSISMPLEKKLLLLAEVSNPLGMTDDSQIGFHASLRLHTISCQRNAYDLEKCTPCRRSCKGRPASQQEVNMSCLSTSGSRQDHFPCLSLDQS